MTATQEFIQRLEALKEAERFRLRRLSGQPLVQTLQGFDIFTGLWWPLREKSRAAPRRDASWLVAKLYGAFPIRHVRPEEESARPTLPRILGQCEPGDEHSQRRFRARFDALLCSSLSALEPHLKWALSVVADALAKQRCVGLDWAQLLNDLSIWDRGVEHRRERDIRDIWAEQYMNAVNHPERRN